MSLRREGVLVLAWFAIALATAVYVSGTYSPFSIILVSVATLAIAWAALPGRAVRIDRLSRGWLLALSIAVFIVSLLYPGTFGHGSWLVASRVLTALSAGVVVAAIAGRPIRPTRWANAVIAIMATAGVCALLAAPSTDIDVWHMMQAATSALSHGQNMFTAKWTTRDWFQAEDVFDYLPGSAVVLWPFHVIFGDVRYGILTSLVVTTIILKAVARESSLGPLAACFILLYPKTLYAVQQSWIDPLMLCALCLTAYFVLKDRPGWAIVAFAACLTFKQSAWLLVPLVAIWPSFGWRRTLVAASAAAVFMLPWYIATPSEFYRGVTYIWFDVLPRLDSISLNAAAMEHLWSISFPLQAVAYLLALALIVWRVQRSAWGFLMGSAILLGTQNLVYKDTFFNEWYLVAGLALAGLVFWAHSPPEVDHPGAATEQALAEAVERSSPPEQGPHVVAPVPVA